MKYQPNFTTKVAGIPCGVVVTHYLYAPPFKGSPWRCDSDLDYYGFTEFEFILVDRKGYRATWLEKKVTKDVEERLLEEYVGNSKGD